MSMTEGNNVIKSFNEKANENDVYITPPSLFEVLKKLMKLSI